MGTRPGLALPPDHCPPQFHRVSFEVCQTMRSPWLMAVLLLHDLALGWASGEDWMSCEGFVKLSPKLESKMPSTSLDYSKLEVHLTNDKVRGARPEGPPKEGTEKWGTEGGLWGEGGGWMDGWMDGQCGDLGGNSQAHGPIALFSRSPYQQRFLNLGLANPRDLGSCVIKLVTRQVMVGKFKQPSPPDCHRTPGQLEAPSPPPPWVPTST